jgi:uncharacterized lipoprotein YmbA
MRGPFRRLRLLALACLCFAGCVHVGQQQESPWRLFTLSPLPATEAAQRAVPSAPQQVECVIGLDPIDLPGYLDQDQLVTRISRNHVALSDNERWAEPLGDNMAQVLSQNLSMLLQPDRVILYPWSGQQWPNYQLEIDVLSFEIDTAGTARLGARWFLRAGARRQLIAEKESRLSALATGSSSEQSVAGLSRVLSDFSVEVAGVIGETVQHCQSP